MAKSRVFVTLKTEVLDPQGQSVEQALHTLGYEGIKSVRIGKVIDIEWDPNKVQDPRAALQAMATSLLANTVIEDFSVEV